MPQLDARQCEGKRNAGIPFGRLRVLSNPEMPDNILRAIACKIADSTFEPRSVRFPSMQDPLSGKQAPCPGADLINPGRDCGAVRVCQGKGLCINVMHRLREEDLY